MGYSVQPVRNHLPPHNRRRLADKNQEGRLESVLGFVMAKESAADAPDHRAVSVDEGGEGRFIPALEEAPEELRVRQPASVSQEHPA
jgi:hypothetical protein